MSPARVLERLRSESGSVIVVCIVLLTIMTGLTLAVYAFVDAEQRNSARERTRESSFNLAEAALSGQVYVLSRDWPGTGSGAYPASCTQSSGGARCPSNQTLTQWYNGPDFRAGVVWTTSVRDNGGSATNFYSDAVTANEPAWDANGDRKIWVRSQALVRGKRRTLVGLVRVEQVTETFPQNTVTAGKFHTSNDGNKVIVDTQGQGAQSAPVAVRCNTPPESDCMGYDPDKGQISPPNTTLGYAGGNAMSDEALDRMRRRAIAIGSYYASGCPANPSGALVFIENGNCSYEPSAGECCNSRAAPGVLIINRGTFYLGGNTVFYGLVYAANRQNSSDFVVTLGGTSAIEGSVAVDGPGGVEAGASGTNIVANPSIFSTITSFSGAGIIQNTWREIQA
jgi:hypothetical protein